MYYIGIDLGTSAVKLLLMDGEGRVYRTVSEEYPLNFPKPGWSEQDPQDWYEKTVAGLKRLTEGFDKTAVRAVSFSGQMHGLVALDGNDRVLRPAILWNDGRTAEETEYLNREIGKERISALTANIAFAGFTAPKLLWMKKNEPELFAKIRKIMLPKDYLNYRLTGNFCTDYSDAAGTLLLDVKNRRWSGEMLQICGIDSSVLPRLCESFEVTGTILPHLSEELGFSENVLVAAGAADNAAAAVGNGIVGKRESESAAKGVLEALGGRETSARFGERAVSGSGRPIASRSAQAAVSGNGEPAASGSGQAGCSVSLGTSGTILIPSADFKPDPANGLHVFSHADGGWYMMGCMLSAASCWKWWMEEILHTRDNEAEQKNLARLGKNKVFYLPYLMGERSPHNDPGARAAFIGMDASTSREDMSLAVLEGVLFALRDSLEIARAQGVDPSFARICGGGAKSPLWKRLAANILGLAIEAPENEEGPAFGAAILAAAAGGEFKSVGEAAEKLCRVKETILPEEELMALYQEKYETFRKLYPALKGIFKGHAC